MRAYTHPDIDKTTFVAEIQAHQEADRFLQGVYWDEDIARGCAVGCSIQSLNVKLGIELHYKDHAAYEKFLGIPRILEQLEDRIFEGLPVEVAKEWPLRFSRAIPQGADLSGVWNAFAPWMLREIVLPVVQREKYTRQREAVERVIKGYETGWKDDSAYAAADAAYADADADAAAAYVAANAAEAAADATYADNAAAAAATYAANAAEAAEVAADAAAAAADAAAAAADAAEAAAADAAEAAAANAADAAAANAADAAAANADVDAAANADVDASRINIRQETYKLMSDKLVELLAAAPVGE